MELERNQMMENEEPEKIEVPVEEAPPVDPPADAHCPNCNGPGIRKGKTIACQVCDASFRYTKEGPKVAELGPFDKLEARVTNLEGGGVAEPAEPQPAEPAEPQPAEPAEPQPAEPIDDDGI